MRRLRQGHALLRARDGVCEHEERCVRVRVRQRRVRRGVRACRSSRTAARCGQRFECVRPRGRDGAVGVRRACRCERGDAAPRCAGRREYCALRAVDGAGRRADRCAERVAAERRRALHDGGWRLARCKGGGERRGRAGGTVRVRCRGAERCTCGDRHVSRGVCADGNGLPAGCREADAACVSSRLAVLAVRTGAGAVGPAARAVRAGCVRRCPRDGDDWRADGGGGRRCAGACRWRCRAGRGCARWRSCVLRECARGCVGRRCAARVGEPGVRCAWAGVRQRGGGQRVRRRSERQRRCADRWRAAGAAGVGVVCVRVVAVGARQQHQRQDSVGAVVPAECRPRAEHADAPRERWQRASRDGRHRCACGCRPTVRCGVPDAQRAGAAAYGLQVRRHHRGIPPCDVWRVRRRRALLCCCDEGDVGVVQLPLC
ncbi:putative dispersed protein family protein 1 (DGF-1) [Trypanosoma cruzi Dm28c]|uniref:Putative dispersed protein family protein 1 (DGF-1) n=1 Tax=Trypanosoma cruzi Dm28c TaxID=1416333 RepID=V5AJ69_TRYCR|nr:putative dispersed protein family protein 1 (DGF-1) [Trypanosoma cruzi Dm28c]